MEISYGRTLLVLLTNLQYVHICSSPFSSLTWVGPQQPATPFIGAGSNPWYRQTSRAASNPWYIGGESRRGIVERRPASESFEEDDGPVARMMRIFGFLPPKAITMLPNISTGTTTPEPTTTITTITTQITTTSPEPTPTSTENASSTTTLETKSMEESKEEEERQRKAFLAREVCPFFAEPLIKYRSYIECNPRSFQACDTGYLCDRSPVYNRHICCRDSTGFVSVVPQTENTDEATSTTTTEPTTTTTEEAETTTTEKRVQFHKNSWTPWEESSTSTSTTTEVPPPAPWAAWAANTLRPWDPLPASSFLPPYSKPSTLPPLPPKPDVRERRPSNIETTTPVPEPAQSWSQWGQWKQTTTTTTPTPWTNWGTWRTPKPAAWTPWNPWTKTNKPETANYHTRNIGNPSKPSGAYYGSKTNTRSRPDGTPIAPGDPEVRVTPLTTGRAVKLPNGDYEWETTITLIQDGTVKILVDTGVPTDTNAILRGLGRERTRPEEIQMVVITHGHPDHFGNQNIFARKRQLFHTVEFVGNRFSSTSLENQPYRKLSKNTEIWKTPGHTPQDVSVIVRNVPRLGTVAVVGDLILNEQFLSSPDQFTAETTWDASMQQRNVHMVICMADTIIPAHGPLFHVSMDHRRQAKCP